MTTYNVLIEGKILPGNDPQAVRERISKLYNLHDRPDHLEKLFSRRRVIVRKHLNRDEAEAYCRTVMKTGMACRIVPETPARQAPDKTVNDNSADPSTTEDSNQVEADTVSPDAALNVPPPSHQPSDSNEHDVLVLSGPFRLDARAGWDWIREGYYYFRTNKAVWIVTVLAYLAIMVGLSFIPFISLLVNVLSPVFGASFILACHRQFLGEKPGFGIVFSAFRTPQLGKLVTVGIAYTVGYLLIGALAVGGFMLVGGGLDETRTLTSNTTANLVVLLISLGLTIPLMMSYWFAPALVVMHDMPALKAMGMSLKGCLRNVLPFLVYSVIIIALGFLAAIPLFLGFIIWWPVMFATMFASYRSVFTEVTWD